MKPMLAATAKSLEQLRFPLLLTPKLDGIRCLRVGQGAYSRAFKLIPNRHIQALVSTLPVGVDGELIADHFNEATSSVMSEDGEPDFTYALFDTFAVDADYWDRTMWLQSQEWPDWVTVLKPTLVSNLDEFLAVEADYLMEGHEGVIARCARGPYHYGRCTLNRHYMIKWKRFHDSEAIIVGYKEGRTNLNPQVPNAFGRMKRPGGGLLKLPNGTLGALLVRDIHTNVEFSIGTGDGLNDELRATIWNNQAAYLNRIIRYKCATVGQLNKPRFPSFQGFRDEADM